VYYRLRYMAENKWCIVLPFGFVESFCVCCSGVFRCRFTAVVLPATSVCPDAFCLQQLTTSTKRVKGVAVQWFAPMCPVLRVLPTGSHTSCVVVHVQAGHIVDVPSDDTLSDATAGENCSCPVLAFPPCPPSPKQTHPQPKHIHPQQTGYSVAGSVF
jgi:hypothetical protein